MKVVVLARRIGPRGNTYKIKAGGRQINVLLTFHALERIERWRITDKLVIQTLLFPEEVLRGHRGRFIAHRRVKDRVVRVVYEYAGKRPVVITVYNPSAKRYFQGGGVHEDQILG